jgi:hypothetical protein
MGAAGLYGEVSRGVPRAPETEALSNTAIRDVVLDDKNIAAWAGPLGVSPHRMRNLAQAYGPSLSAVLSALDGTTRSAA